MAIVLSSATAPRRSKSLFSTLVSWLTSVAESQTSSLRRDIEKLEAMSDRELADIGIKRSEIAARVCQGRSYL